MVLPSPDPDDEHPASATSVVAATAAARILLRFIDAPLLRRPVGSLAWNSGPCRNL
jgi:hypothetical protein